MALSLLALGACGDQLEPLLADSSVPVDPPLTAPPLDPRPGDIHPEAEAPMMGYTLFCVPAPVATPTQSATLIDMDGNVVHKWKIVGIPVVMLPGGSILGARSQRPGSGVAFQDTVELAQLDWHGATEFSFSEWDDDGTGIQMSRQHHDMQRQGNPVGYYAPGQNALVRGNTLVLAHRDRFVSAVSDKELQDDVIYEVSIDASLTGFTWYAADHIEEMGFDAEARAGIYKNPNWSEVRSTGDWLHINSAATLGRNRWYEKQGDARFHPDNIIISSREANFLAIISRESGKIVWRVGPEMGPGTPFQDLGQLVGQHHAQMIPHGLPGAGNIMVFDNGGFSGYGGPKGYYKNSRLWSRVLEFNPVTLKKVWQYGSAVGPDFLYAFFLSSAQRLPNGNTLITNGADGTLLEVTRHKRVVWKHVVMTGGVADDVYRAFRVPPEWLPRGINPARYQRWDEIYTP